MRPLPRLLRDHESRTSEPFTRVRSRPGGPGGRWRLIAFTARDLGPVRPSAPNAATRYVWARRTLSRRKVLRTRLYARPSRYTRYPATGAPVAPLLDHTSRACPGRASAIATPAGAGGPPAPAASAGSAAQAAASSGRIASRSAPGLVIYGIRRGRWGKLMPAGRMP
jgi:hypothetical protein